MNSCPEHNKTIQYYCLNPSCQKTSVACFLCLKNDHSKCPDELLVEKDEASEKINILENQIDPKTITTKLN